MIQFKAMTDEHNPEIETFVHNMAKHKPLGVGYRSSNCTKTAKYLVLAVNSK